MVCEVTALGDRLGYDADVRLTLSQSLESGGIHGVIEKADVHALAPAEPIDGLPVATGHLGELREVTRDSCRLLAGEQGVLR